MLRDNEPGASAMRTAPFPQNVHLRFFPVHRRWDFAKETT